MYKKKISQREDYELIERCAKYRPSLIKYHNVPSLYIPTYNLLCREIEDEFYKMCTAIQTNEYNDYYTEVYSVISKIIAPVKLNKQELSVLYRALVLYTDDKIKIKYPFLTDANIREIVDKIYDLDDKHKDKLKKYTKYSHKLRLEIQNIDTLLNEILDFPEKHFIYVAEKIDSDSLVEVKVGTNKVEIEYNNAVLLKNKTKVAISITNDFIDIKVYRKQLNIIDILPDSILQRLYNSILSYNGTPIII